MRWDYQTYLRDGLLPKIDRATMLVALEARAPYLDQQVTDFAVGLPTRLKVRGLTTKWLFKRVARRRVPAEVVARRKHGLSVPISALINGELSAETERLLSYDRLRRQGLLNPGYVGQLLSQHRAGNFGLARGLWTLIVLQKWMDVWG
jgi:asparagine synthase (glutamine-hydrolysing)